MAVLSPEQVAQVLYQAGARGDVLTGLVAIGKRESGYKSDAHRTDNPGGNTGDYGLFQINYVNWPGIRQALGLGPDINQLLDPVVNAKAALYLYQKGGWSPWSAGPGGWTSGADPWYGTNRQAAAAAVQRAQQQGLLGQDWSNTGATQGPSGGTGTPGADAAGGPMTLPPDAKLYNNGFGVFAVFDIGGVNISYAVQWWNNSVTIDQSKVQNISAEQWQALGAVNGGDAEELRDLGQAFGTYKEFFDSILGQVLGYTNPAKDDPDVLKVIAEFASRPDMTSAELTNKLQATTWYQQHTQGELEWNSLGEAEKQKRRDAVAAQMSQQWFSFTGEAVLSDDPRLANYLEDVASGKMGLGAWTENVVKAAALDNPTSPWARQITDEQKAQLQPGIDMENTVQRIKDLARRWGVQWSEGAYQDWARQITSNGKSDADVLQALQAQSQVLYAWKDPTMETSTAAAPWVETYKRVMEREADLFNPKVQSALSAGQPIWEFEQTLKKSQEWLNTKNAREELTSTVAEAGRRMGFE